MAARDENADTRCDDRVALNRRMFLGASAALGAGFVAGRALSSQYDDDDDDHGGDNGGGGNGDGGGDEVTCDLGPLTQSERLATAHTKRVEGADIAFARPVPEQLCNGEEDDYPYIANYSKGLPHDAQGEVIPAAYLAMLDAIASEDEAAFEAVPLGGTRKLVNPHAGHAFDLEGADSHHMTIRPAPRMDGPEHSAEMGEMYWHALLRDVSFTRYQQDQLVAAATADLSNFSDFRGPKVGGLVRPSTIFRIDLPGALRGPYVSQFLLRNIPYGTLTISQRQRTARAGVDYMTTWPSWLKIQRGIAPTAADVFDQTRRYIRNGRDLATYVHYDALYEAYLNACLILLGIGAPLNPGNPYLSKQKTEGFGTFGGPHILSLVTEVATRALKAVWYQKWHVHRRMRPEVMGGRVHANLARGADHPIDGEILDSRAVQKTRNRFGTYLLPQAFPEGSPLHPAYGSGHTTVAGACVTVLKWFFDEAWVLPSPVVPNPDGTALVAWNGPALRVGGELNKVAMNVSMGRNFAGIHWRTDSTESLKLGEEVAICILQEQKITYAETHEVTFTRFDGRSITI